MTDGVSEGEMDGNALGASDGFILRLGSDDGLDVGVEVGEPLGETD